MAKWEIVLAAAVIGTDMRVQAAAAGATPNHAQRARLQAG